jgi:septal ring factor EnvC (AmiA/AmiB activator)
MSALTPAEQEEFQKMMEAEAHARKLEKQRERRARERAERLAREEAILVKKRAAAAKAREALAEIRAGKRTSQRAIERAERLKARREEAVKKAAAKVREVKEEAPKEPIRYPTPATVCPPLRDVPVRWRLTDGSTTIDLGAPRENIIVQVDGSLVVNLNPQNW